MHTKVKQLDFTGKKIYAGIDVHKRHFTVTIQGESLVYKTFNQPPAPSVLVEYLHRHYPGATYYACYEAGFCGFWIQEHLEVSGINCIVVNACDVPTTDKEKKQKRDKIDSNKLARGLKNGELSAIHIPKRYQQRDRSLVRTRKKIVGNQTRTRNRIKGLLYFFGIDFPEQFQKSGTHWSKCFMRWLAAIDLGEESGNTTLSLLLKEADFLRGLLLESDRAIRKLSRQERYNKEVELLLSIPGIGRLTAMILLTELGEINRFKHLDHLCSYVGLIPNIYSSGDKEMVGDITKRGNGYLKSHLIESSWVAVRADPALALKYEELRNRMNGNKAIIRITRKLLSRIRHVLKNEEKYEIGIAA